MRGVGGRIDILVNNVGGSEPGGPVEMSEEMFDQQIDHNLKTVFLGCKHVLPIMERQGAGSIVNIASVAALRDHLGRTLVAYSASKAGVIQLSRATGVKYAKLGVRVNTVVPGLMNTPLVTHRLARQIGGNDPEALIADRNRRVPIGHMGEAWDIAHAVPRLRRGALHHRDRDRRRRRHDRDDAVRESTCIPGR